MRFRHDWCSDPCRIMRQQQVLRAMVAKVKGDRVNTLLHLPAICSRSSSATCRPILPTPSCSALASYYQGISETDIANDQVPYTDDIDLPGYGDSLVPDTAERARLVAKLLVPQPSAAAFARCDRAWPRSRRRAARRRRERQRPAGCGASRRRRSAPRRIFDRDGGRRGPRRLRRDGDPRAHDHRRSPERAFVPRCRRRCTSSRSYRIPRRAATPASGPSPKSDVTVIVGDGSGKGAARAAPYVAGVEKHEGILAGRARLRRRLGMAGLHAPQQYRAGAW